MHDECVDAVDAHLGRRAGRAPVGAFRLTDCAGQARIAAVHDVIRAEAQLAADRLDPIGTARGIAPAELVERQALIGFGLQERGLRRVAAGLIREDREATIVGMRRAE
jgi:hypothetical protein